VHPDLSQATTRLVAIVRDLRETPAYLHEQVRQFATTRTSRLEAAVDGCLLLWDVSSCEDLPQWVRLEADRLRRRLWPAAYLRGRALEAELERLCAKR